MSDSEEEVQEKQFKVVIVGDGSAGKVSSLENDQLQRSISNRNVK